MPPCKNFPESPLTIANDNLLALVRNPSIRRRDRNSETFTYVTTGRISGGSNASNVSSLFLSPSLSSAIYRPPLYLSLSFGHVAAESRYKRGGSPRKLYKPSTAMGLFGGLVGVLVAAGAARLARAAPAAVPTVLRWEMLQSGVTDQLASIDTVTDKIVWVGGGNGTVLRTTDGGDTWKRVGPTKNHTAADDSLEFHSVAAQSATHAMVLAIGDGPLYVTTDGGETWKSAFENDIAEAFFHSLAFGNAADMQIGVALSDPVSVGYPTFPGQPVDRKFSLVETRDGGKTWNPVNTDGMPPALVNEAAFDASGTCLASGPGGRFYIGTGGADQARVFRSADGGHTWNVSRTPVASGNARGIFSVSFGDERRGIAVGGDYRDQTRAEANAAWSGDGGATWSLAKSLPGGYRSGSSWVPGLEGTAVAVGPTGTDITTDGGRNWRALSNDSFDAIQCPTQNVCFASGERGAIARLVIK